MGNEGYASCEANRCLAMRARFSERCLRTTSNSSSTSSTAPAIWLPSKSFGSDTVPNTWLHKMIIINNIEGRMLKKRHILVVELYERSSFLLVFE